MLRLARPAGPTKSLKGAGCPIDACKAWAEPSSLLGQACRQGEAGAAALRPAGPLLQHPPHTACTLSCLWQHTRQWSSRQQQGGREGALALLPYCLLPIMPTLPQNVFATCMAGRLQAGPSLSQWPWCHAAHSSLVLAGNTPSIPSTQVLAATLSHASWMFTAASVLTIGATSRVEAGTLVLLFARSHSRLGRLGQLAARLAAQQRSPAPPFDRHCPGCRLCLRLGGRHLLIGPCFPPVNGLACIAVGHALVLDSGLIILHRKREDISSDCRVQGAWQALLFSMQPLQQLQRRTRSQQRPSSSG